MSNTEKYNRQNPLYERRVKSQEWADSFHGKVVFVRVNGQLGRPGVAMSCINPGGWGYLKVIYQEAPSGYRSFETINGRNYLTGNFHWALFRDLVHEMTLSQMILHRLKGDNIGGLLAHVK